MTTTVAYVELRKEVTSGEFTVDVSVNAVTGVTDLWIDPPTGEAVANIRLTPSEAQALGQALLDEPDDGYTREPTHLRVYREETGDEYVWHIDGADNHGRYTEDVRRFATFKECFMYADLFVVDAEYDGVTWKWDTSRKTRIRPKKGNRATLPGPKKENR